LEIKDQDKENARVKIKCWAYAKNEGYIIIE
jgi:hypothetical protein